MAEPSILDFVPSFFKAGDTSDPRVNQALRQRIALQLMANKKAYPKNVGEGLSAIGDAIGDRGLAQQLAQSDIEAQDAAAKLGAGAPTGTPGYAPTDTAVSPAVGAINGAISGGAPTPVAAAPAALAPTTSVSGIQPAVSPVPRNNITGALMAQQQPPAQAVPQQNPTLSGADGAPGGQPDQRLALLAPGGPPTTAGDIQAAPPVPSQMRQAPSVQVAQADKQQYPPGYIPPQPGAPQGAPIIGMSQRERELRLLLAKNQGNPYASQSPAAVELGNLVEQRTARQSEANELYKAQITRDTEQARQRLEAQRGQAKAIVEVGKEQEALTKAQQENQLRTQFGNMPPDEVFKQVNASKTIAKSAAQALIASQNATKALDGGAILGSGANQRLDVAKFFTGIGLVDKGNAIANTEVFKAAMQPIVASILHQTSGTSQLSDNELAFAKSAAAGNITLDPQSIRQLLTIIDKRSNEVLKDHQTLTGALFGKNNPQANALFGVEAPKPAVTAGGIVDVTSEAEAANLPKGTKVRINGRIGTVQ